MPIQQVEYKFPDPDNTGGKEVEVEVTDEGEFELEIEGAVGREEVGKPKPKQEVEVEVIDDTPKVDRGRKSSSPPEEVTDEELENYSEKVKKRIKHFSKGYHDERRAKEIAERQKEEAISYAGQLVAENKKLKGSVDSSHNSLIESAKKQVQSEMVVARKQYKDAYESGEPDSIVTAQEGLNAAQIRMDKVERLRPRVRGEVRGTLQPPQNTVQSQVQRTQPPVERDEKAEAWRDENPWFGDDDEMTALALGLHTKLTKGGTSPQSDEYYEKINSRMRQLFPAEFDEGVEDGPAGRRKKSSNVVAPATRSTSPRKVTLSQTQVALAKRLGVPLEEYAKQAAVLMRKQD